MFSGGIGLWNDQLVSDYSSWLASELSLPNRESISPENENEWLIFTREILEANHGSGLRGYFAGRMQDVLTGLSLRIIHSQIVSGVISIQELKVHWK